MDLKALAVNLIELGKDLYPFELTQYEQFEQVIDTYEDLKNNNVKPYIDTLTFELDNVNEEDVYLKETIQHLLENLKDLQKEEK